ncbi:MAG: histidine triad nucleotide-binding protein [Streptomycetaceae bacterium]|nr:MAG: histidine triad nucleotide-binding protein [Streptomycetaceae bacterium]
MSQDANCLFCRIVTGDIPADIVARTQTVLAFNDIDPQAPTHVLLVPIRHCANAAELAAQSPEVLAELFSVASDIAASRGITGYRTVFNTGAEAGQSVFHVHLHLIGGRSLAWPPG